MLAKVSIHYCLDCCLLPRLKMLCITDKWDKMGIKIEDKMWGLVLHGPHNTSISIIIFFLIDSFLCNYTTIIQVLL